MSISESDIIAIRYAADMAPYGVQLCRLRGEPEYATPEDIADAILSEQNSLTIRPREFDAAALWNALGWTSALLYYSASKDIPYIDAQGDATETRREALATYRHTEAAPMPRTTVDDDALVLGDVVDPLADPDLLLASLRRRRTSRTFSLEKISARTFMAGLSVGLEKIGMTRRRASNARLGNGELKSFGVAFDFFIVVYAVEGLTSGLYFYDPQSLKLALLKPGSFREEMAGFLHRQQAPLSASWTLILTSDWHRMQWRYRHERGLRNLYIDAGRIAQELILAWEAEGLSSFPTPALREAEICSFLGVSAQSHSPIYTISTGGIA